MCIELLTQPKSYEISKEGTTKRMCFALFVFVTELVAELKSQIPDVENIFKIHRRIGEGTFSTVFLTSLRAHEHLPNKRLFALKYLIPTSHPRRIAQELRCLREIG